MIINKNEWSKLTVAEIKGIRSYSDQLEALKNRDHAIETIIMPLKCYIMANDKNAKGYDFDGKQDEYTISSMIDTLYHEYARLKEKKLDDAMRDEIKNLLLDMYAAIRPVSTSLTEKSSQKK